MKERRFGNLQEILSAFPLFAELEYKEKNKKRLRFIEIKKYLLKATDRMQRLGLTKEEIHSFRIMPLEPNRTNKMKNIFDLIKLGKVAAVKKILLRAYDKSEAFMKACNYDLNYMCYMYNQEAFDKSVIEERYLVYQVDHMGLTPLHWAVKENDLEMATMLLEELNEGNEPKAKWRSDPNQEDFFHRTPLFLAV